MQTARIGDIDIQYELIAYTPPWSRHPPQTILLHHGYARNMLFWQPLIPLLAGNYRVLRFNARGSSETTLLPSGNSYSLDQFAGDAVGLLDELEIERVHWIGESSGGIVGMSAALNHASRLSSLTLCDTPFKRPQAMTAVYSAGEQDRSAAFEKFGVGEWCRRTLSVRLDTSRASPELCEWYIEQMGRTPVPVAIALEHMIGAGDLWPALPRITTPTLILAGENSAIANEAMTKEMQLRLPAAKLVRLTGYGHAVHILAPDECAREIRSFIEAIR